MYCMHVSIKFRPSMTYVAVLADIGKRCFGEIIKFLNVFNTMKLRILTFNDLF